MELVPALVFDANLSSLILNVVFFGCIGILLSQACSKLKQSTVSGVFVESKLHSKTMLTQASFWVHITYNIDLGSEIDNLVGETKYVYETPNKRR